MIGPINAYGVVVRDPPAVTPVPVSATDIVTVKVEKLGTVLTSKVLVVKLAAVKLVEGPPGVVTDENLI